MVPPPDLARSHPGARGLTSAEAIRRQRIDGPNELPRQTEPTLLRRAARQLMEPLTLVLVAAAICSVTVLGHTVEGLAIVAIVVLNVGVGTAQERKAATSMAALERMVAPTARVRRDGITLTVPASEIVVGDHVELSAGDRIPADLLLSEAESLSADEALISGEAFPVDKFVTGTVGAGGSAADRPGELFAGTTIVRGRGAGTVQSVGASTLLGSIATSLGLSTSPPLVGELRHLAARMSVLAVVLGAALIPVAAIRGEGDDALAGAVLAGVALAVAAIPEGLGTVVVTSLALGARRMAGRGVIVRQLAAIEGLGSATVLCTDKTGTITTGVLAVSDATAVPGREVDLWAAAARCNDAHDGQGDPVDVALADAATTHGAVVDGDRCAERPFDADSRMMATIHLVDGSPALSVKGAPEAVLGRCAPGPDTDHLIEAASQLAAGGLRVLALADAPTADLDASGLRPLGIVAFHDPLRPSTVAAVEQCRRAGLRVVLVTGDHVATSTSIARSVGIVGPVVSGDDLATSDEAARRDALLGAAVIARVDPATKLALVEAHQGAGTIVAMTGDGVNDAPALRRADIGIAVAGEGGTDVAREAADVVVTNGDLETIAAAIGEGRRIRHNLQSVVAYLVTGNLSEILVVATALVLLPALAVPLLPVQLLWVNLVTDGLPALALGLDRSATDPLDLPPAARTGGLLGRGGLGRLAARAAVVASCVTATGLAGAHWNWTDHAIRTQMLLTLLAAHVLLAFPSRARRHSFERGWSRNHSLTAAIGASLGVQVVAFGTLFGRTALDLSALPATSWLLAGAASLGAIGLIDLARLGRRTELEAPDR